MANWNNLKAYINANYKVAEDQGSLVKLIFTFDSGRSQLVLVTHTTTGAGIEFATITSPFAKVGEVDLGVALRELNEYVVGGAVIVGDFIVVRHAVPMDALDADDFEAPLHLVLNAAEAMEQKFVGTDNF